MKILKAIRGLFRNNPIDRLIRGYRQQELKKKERREWLKEFTRKNYMNIRLKKQRDEMQYDDCYIEWEEPDDFPSSMPTMMGFGLNADEASRRLYKYIGGGK